MLKSNYDRLAEAHQKINYLESLIDVVVLGELPKDITFDHLKLLPYHKAFMEKYIVLEKEVK